MCGYFWIGFIDFMLNGKILTDVTNLFSQNTFKDNCKIMLKYIKTGEAPDMYPDLSDQTQFRLKTVNESFVAEI